MSLARHSDKNLPISSDLVTLNELIKLFDKKISEIQNDPILSANEKKHNQKFSAVIMALILLFLLVELRLFSLMSSSKNPYEASQMLKTANTASAASPFVIVIGAILFLMFSSSNNVKRDRWNVEKDKLNVFLNWVQQWNKELSEEARDQLFTVKFEMEYLNKDEVSFSHLIDICKKIAATLSDFQKKNPHIERKEIAFFRNVNSSKSNAIQQGEIVKAHPW